MEYRLGRLYDKTSTENSKIELHDLIDQSEFNKINLSLNIIEDLNAIIRLKDFVVLNDEEIIDMLNNALQGLLDKSVVWNGIKRDHAEEVFLNINRLLLNYLTSIKTFLDHSETFLKRKFGKQSTQVAEFKKLTSYFYDNSFAYRFFSQLRNYAQHVGLPLDGINFSIKYDQVNKGIEGNLNIKFNRDRLLQSFDGWKHVKADLEKMDDKFFVTPLLFEMTHNIKEIERNLELILKEELLSAAKMISNKIDKLRDDGCEIFIAHQIKVDEIGKITDFEQMIIPLDRIDYILSIHE